MTITAAAAQDRDSDWSDIPVGPIRELLGEAHSHPGCEIRSMRWKKNKDRDDWRGTRIFFKALVTCARGEQQFFIKGEQRSKEGAVTLTARNYASDIYEEFLNPSGLDMPTYYGGFDDDSGTSWLVLEFVKARRLCRFSDQGIWNGVASWLADMHAFFRAGREGLEVADWLPRHDAEYYMETARRAEQAAADVSRRAGVVLADLASSYREAVAEPLGSSPLTTLVHGEFYCTNVFVQVEGGRVSRVAPFDWETAALGGPIHDLAYLMRQKVIDKDGVKRAYVRRAREIGDVDISSDLIEQQLRLFRVHELMYRIWVRARHKQSRRDAIPEYVEKVARLIAELPA